MLAILGLLALGCLATIPASAQVFEDAHSLCLPSGPPPAGGYEPYVGEVCGRGTKVIGGVPAYLWQHGCGPTAAGMVIGYWDGHGFPLLIPGDASTQTEAVNQAIASTAHYDDYSVPIDSSPNLLLDKSSLGGAHSPHNCLGDFMNTSWSSRQNYYGWSWFSDVDDSLLGYTNTYVNNTYGASYTATVSNETWGAFTWADFQAEIDADRPMIFLVDANQPYGQTDHFVPAIGYRDTNGYPEYACFDTWSTGMRWERFRQMSASYAWGIYGATYYRVGAPPPAYGSIVVWGNNEFGQCNVPAPNSGFVAVAGGGSHSLGLKADGSIVAWARNDYGQCDVPAPNSGFVAVAGGGYYGLGLKADGSIVAWGRNDYGQCNVPAPNSGFVAAAGGYHHSLGLKADGSIVAWGRNVSGQCNVPAPNSGFVAVAGGLAHSLGLKADGSIRAWGSNDLGQCNVPAPNSGYVAIAGGAHHSLGLKADGSVVAWGWNIYGQCSVPPPNSGFVAVAGGYGHSLGLKANGSIVAWGYNYYGQCNVPAPNSGFVATAGGFQHSLGLQASYGDLNCDGVINFDDINAFVLALSGEEAYQAAFPSCHWLNADCNADGQVSFDDINAFVALLSGG
jgi:hypothetical protein